MNTGIGMRNISAWKLAMVVNATAGDELLDTYEAESARHQSLTRGRAGFGRVPGMRRLIPAAAVLAALLGAANATAADRDGQPRLEARAILPATRRSPAPFPGVPNTDPAPAPGSTQPVGGFSALLDAGNGELWAMPDNGFGNKANSRSFLLRLYRVKPRWETKYGGPGTVQIREAITLSDPDEQGAVPDRQREHRGPAADRRRLRHRVRAPHAGRHAVVRRGVRPVHRAHRRQGPRARRADRDPADRRQPRVMSPDNPYLFGRTPNLGGSNGFEAMALSARRPDALPDPRGPVAGDDPLDRRVYEFDVRERRYTGRSWTYRMSTAGMLVSDATAFGRDQIIVTERDNNQGEAAAYKKAFIIDVPDRRPVLAKREIVDLLDIRDPNEISLPGRPGDFGLGDPFEFPYVTVEAVLPLGGNDLAFVNDTNFGSTGRNPSLPDYSDFIIVNVPGSGKRVERRVDVRLGVVEVERRAQPARAGGGHDPGPREPLGRVRDVGAHDRGVARRSPSPARKRFASARSCSWIVSTPISLITRSDRLGADPREPRGRGVEAPRALAEPQRRAELVLQRVRRRVPARLVRSQPLGERVVEHHERRPARAHQPLVGGARDGVEARRVERQPADPVRRVDHGQRVVVARRGGDVVERGDLARRGLHGDTATTSTEASIASASRVQRHHVDRHAALRLGQEREQQRGELRLGRDHARAVRDRRPRPARSARRRSRRRRPARAARARASRTPPARGRSPRSSAPSSRGPRASPPARSAAPPTPGPAAARSSPC